MIKNYGLGNVFRMKPWIRYNINQGFPYYTPASQNEVGAI